MRVLLRVNEDYIIFTLLLKFAQRAMARAILGVSVRDKIRN